MSVCLRSKCTQTLRNWQKEAWKTHRVDCLPADRTSFIDGVGPGFNCEEETASACLTGPGAAWLGGDSTSGPLEDWKKLGWTNGFTSELLSIGSVISSQSEPSRQPAMPWQQGLNLHLDNEPKPSSKALPELQKEYQDSIQLLSAANIQLDQWERRVKEEHEQKSLGIWSAATAATWIPYLNWPIWLLRGVGQ